MYVKVRVIAGAKKEEVIAEKADHFKIFVRQKAERNLANGRVIEIIAAQFRVKPTQVRIISGHHSPSKLLSVDVEKSVTK